jgi:hypothetical protein
VDAPDTSASTRVFDALLPAHDGECAASVMARLVPAIHVLLSSAQDCFRDS